MNQIDIEKNSLRNQVKYQDSVKRENFFIRADEFEFISGERKNEKRIKFASN